MQNNTLNTKKRIQSILGTYSQSQTYIVSGGKGSVKNYKYFLYPFKNFSITDPKDEQFIAEALSKFINKDIECLVTFEADGIGITKLISVILDIPMIVCKPFHYNQEVFSFVQRTGYQERTMYCPKIIEAKKIGIVDCIISTGGTITGFMDALDSSGLKTKILGIYSVVNKDNHNGNNRFGKIDYRYLFDIYIDGQGKVQASISKDFKDRIGNI